MIYQNSKTPILQNSKTPKLQNSKTPKLQSSKTPKLQNSKTPQLQSTKTPKLQNSKIHRLTPISPSFKSTSNHHLPKHSLPNLNTWGDTCEQTPDGILSTTMLIRRHE